MDSKPSHVVLGATGGIGSELCHQVCASGAHVVAASRNSDKVRELAENFGVRPFTLDATDIEQVAACLADAQQTFGRVNGVANCVGSLLPKPAHLTSYAEWQATLTINLTSAFAAVRAGAKTMMQTGGSIVLVSSAAARRSCQPKNLNVWPQWRGPGRDGQLTGPAWPDRLSKDSLKLVIATLSGKRQPVYPTATNALGKSRDIAHCSM